MIPKVSTWLVAVLAGGALVAGCGSSNNSTSSSTSSSQSSTATSAQARQQAVEHCKHGIQALPSISASAKASLEQSCGKMASGSQTAQQEITKQVCVELVNASHIPAGAARERALAVCKAP